MTARTSPASATSSTRSPPAAPRWWSTPTFERSFYKLAGFRMLGRRAVRIDILERLADLIRPALAWKPGTRPAA